MSIDQLRENPLNAEMYGEPDEEEVALLALDITKRGIRQPLVVTPEGVVVSGHRRLAAARLAGLAEVPCVLQDDVDDARMALEMTLDNAPRKRPFTQLMAHALLLKDIVEPILAARKRHQDPSGLPGYASIAPIIEMMTGGHVNSFVRGEQTFGSVTNVTEGGSVTNVTQLHWEDVVGRLIGMSGRTLRRGMEVYLAALEGDERAGDLCVKLDEGELTINGAYKAFKSRPRPSADDPETDDDGPDEALGLDLSGDGGGDPEESGGDDTDRRALEELTQVMKASLPTLHKGAGSDPAAAVQPGTFARCMRDACEALRHGDRAVAPFVAEVLKEYLRAARRQDGDEGVLSCVLDAGIFDDRLKGFKMSLWVRTFDISWWDDFMRHASKDVPIMAHLEGRWEDDEETQ